MTNTEREALDFLKRWLAWAEAGAVTGEFWPSCGLCGNASITVKDWLRREFGWNVHPFGGDEFYVRMATKTQHECPKRLAWVRAKIAEMEQAQ